MGDRKHDATVVEIAQEKAASLGRAGRRLEEALAALAVGGPVIDDNRLEELLDEAGEAFYFYIVQREACGLNDTAAVIRELTVPREVQLRMRLRKRKRR